MCSSIPRLGRPPGGGHGKLLQYSCLENSMDTGAWQATVHRVVKSQTQLKQLNMGTVLIQHYYLPGIVLGEDVTASFAPH